MPGTALYLISDLDHGGAQRLFVETVNGLEDPRPIPVVLRSTAGLTDSLRPDRPVHVLPGPRGTAPWYLRWFDGPLGLWRRTRGLLSLVSATDASAIVSFEHRSHVIAMCARVVLRGRTPVILSAQETLSQDLHFEHRLFGRIWYEWFAGRFFRQADLLVAVAVGVADDLVAKFGVSPDDIVVLPKPVDVEFVRDLGGAVPERWPDVPPGTAIILGVGRLTRGKGFDLLVRALSRLAAHANAHVVLVGDGPEAGRLHSLARSLGVADRLHMVGFQENPWSYMRRADVLAVPSRTAGVPDVINEAHAIGIPVVATRCSASIGECLEDGGAGVLVQSDDPATLAEALTRILEDGALAARLMRAGRRRVASLDRATCVDRFGEVVSNTVAAGTLENVERESGEARPAVDGDL
jgi:glycosyltransferase involved in cell wall biosynthesis